MSEVLQADDFKPYVDKVLARSRKSQKMQYGNGR
jgi:hypothetical protein